METAYLVIINQSINQNLTFVFSSYDDVRDVPSITSINGIQLKRVYAVNAGNDEKMIQHEAEPITGKQSRNM